MPPSYTRSSIPTALLCAGLLSLFTPPALAHDGSHASPLFSLADIAEKSTSSVVNISSTRTAQAAQSPYMADPMFREFFRHFGPGTPSPRQESSLGSGVIIRSDGIVLTNNHVVKDADQIRVTLSDKREFSAKVVGTDPKSDLAVLKLNKAKGLKPIRLGNSDKLRLGEVVLAIGNPFGVGQTVTMGIVSAKGRANVGIVDYEDFIQTDAAINPGNSGGALINLQGELIGINTAILSRTGGYQGIGFAIPTNMVRPIMNSLLKRGKVVRGWLGVVIQKVDAELVKALKLPTRNGVLISDVDPLGPAQKAGIKRGDLVVKVNGRAVDSPGALRNLVASSGSGGRISIDYYRNKKLISTSVQLGELPSTRAEVKNSSSKREEIRVAPLNRNSRAKFNIPPRVNFGVVVTQLKRQSGAARAGLRPGDVILEVNRVTINSVRRFNKLYSASKGRVLLLVYRQGSTMYMILNK